MTSPTATGDPASLRGAVLDRLAVPAVDPAALDLAADRGEVERLASTRRRIRRGLGAGTVVAVLLLLAATVAVLGREDPDELVADRDEAPSTTVERAPRRTASTTSIVATATSAAPTSTTAAPGPTTTTAPAVVAPPSTEAPPTTVPIDEPLRAQVRAVDARVAAGGTAVVEIGWVHADHVGPAPAITIDWGDPVVAGAPPAPARPDCSGPPRSTGEVSRAAFRYASTGERRVRVTLSACRDGRADGERVTVETTVVVDEPVIAGRPQRVVVLTAPWATLAGIDLPPLDAADVELDPDAPGPTVLLAPRVPALGQLSAVGPATVVLVDVDAVGALGLAWADSPCRATAVLPPAGAVRPAVLELDSTC